MLVVYKSSTLVGLFADHGSRSIEMIKVQHPVISLRALAILGLVLSLLVGITQPALADSKQAKAAQNQLRSSTAQCLEQDACASVESYIAVQLLGFNDYHGHVATNAVGSDQEGGGEYLAAKLAELRKNKKHSFTVAAGDLIGGSPALSGLFHDEPSVESLNAMGLDFASVGNHEFDEGVAELLRMQYGGCHHSDGCYFPGEPFEGADFVWLAANVRSDKDPTVTALLPYWIVSVEGVKIAFIGMTLEGTGAIVAAAGTYGWHFSDEVETANALVPELKRQGVEALIVLLHEGGHQLPAPGEYNGCSNLSGPIVAINAALSPEIDVLITGHTHQPYNCRLKDSEGAERIVASAYKYGRVVTEVSLVLDRNSGDVQRSMSKAYNHPVTRQALEPAPAVTRVIDKWRVPYELMGKHVIGEISADIRRGGATSDDRSVESAAGNLVADAQLWATQDIDSQIAFMNPGGVRTDLIYAAGEGEKDGQITFGEAFSFQPFNNDLDVLTLSGAQIVNILKEQCQPKLGGGDRGFLHLGVSSGFSYDLEKQFNDDGSCTAIISEVKLNGQDLRMDANYRVAVNSFLADGGNNFKTFTEASERVNWGVDLVALTAYFNENSPVDPPTTDRVKELN